ncbi:HAMP domain-containing sensor histidine kinase [Kitasatospora sp. NPDC093806]|uniref:HAMP domain-containing sensor histidine kinase n=1 Tax=Kitasatospora sp. NPDC093806 TaxID=3155075 RepID=UPI00342EFFD3
MLRARIALVVVAATLLAIAVTVTTSYRSVSGLVAEEFDRVLADRADTVVALLDAGRTPAPRPDTTEQLLLPDGTVRPLSPGREPLPVPPGALELARDGLGTRAEEITVGETTYGVLTKGLGAGAGAVLIGQTYADAERVDREFLRQITWTTAAAAAGCAALSWLLLGRVLRPVRRLARAAEHISTTQDLGTPLPPAGRDEVGRLTRSFEIMLDALRRSREAQQRLVQNASHELRTPLTSVRGSAELLQRARGRLAPEDEEQILATLVGESVALDELVRELVELATDRQADEDPVPLDLAVAAEDCAGRFRRRTGRSITVTAGTGVLVLARPRALHRCIDNLLANAVKFSPDGTPVEVHVEALRPGGVRLSVRDHGPGIPPAERQAVFDRFHRGPGTQSVPGSGLGLAIVHDLIAADHGTVFAGAAPGGGAEVGFRLPAPAAADRGGESQLRN